MQINRTLKVLLSLSILLAWWPVIGLYPALALEGESTNINQTKTDASQPSPTSTNTPVPQPSGSPPLTPLTDDQGVIAVAVPAAWNDVAQGEWLLGGAPAGRRLSASPNQADFAANWGTPGITIYYSTSLPAAMEPEDVLAVFDFSGSCEDGGRGALPPAQRTVTYQIWQKCAQAETAVLVLLVQPSAERPYYGVVEIYLSGVDDLRALAPILSTVQFGPAATPSGQVATSVPTPDQVINPTPATEQAPPPTLPPTLPAPTAAPIIATVITDRLNLRSGPSTDLERLTVVTRGMQLSILGQIDACAWLRVGAPDGTQGWVSGDPQYTSLDVACTAIPVVPNP